MERTILILSAVFRRMVVIQRAVVERTVQKMVSYIAQIHFCLNQNDIRRLQTVVVGMHILADSTRQSQID